MSSAQWGQASEALDILRGTNFLWLTWYEASPNEELNNNSWQSKYSEFLVSWTFHKYYRIVERELITKSFIFFSLVPYAFWSWKLCRKWQEAGLKFFLKSKPRGFPFEGRSFMFTRAIALDVPHNENPSGAEAAALGGIQSKWPDLPKR